MEDQEKIDAKRSSCASAIKIEFMRKYWLVVENWFAMINYTNLFVLLLGIGMRSLEKDAYSLKDFLRMRKHQKAYAFFCENFLRCVVGKLEWKKCAHCMKISDIASPTDEAFALLVLENIWDSWTAVVVEEYYKGPVATITEQGKTECKRKAVIGKYTSEYRRASRFGGWSDEGHKRFVQLRTMVIEDRKDEGGFENRYLKQEKERVDREEKKNKKKRKRERVDRCIDDDLTTW